MNREMFSNIKKKDLGIVTSIVGVHQGYLYFEGHQNHAGTTPMSIRNDPVPVAAELISKMSKVGRRKGGSRCSHLWQHELGTGGSKCNSRRYENHL